VCVRIPVCVCVCVCVCVRLCVCKLSTDLPTGAQARCMTPTPDWETIQHLLPTVDLTQNIDGPHLPVAHPLPQTQQVCSLADRAHGLVRHARTRTLAHTSSHTQARAHT
jgi:hypothetical protein